MQTKKPEGEAEVRKTVSATLDPSNLGQIIGRLLYPDALAAPSAPAAEADSTGATPRMVRRSSFRQRSGRSKQLLDLLSQHPEGLNARTLASLAGMDNVSVVSAYLSQMAEVEKSGGRGARIYRLKAQA